MNRRAHLVREQASKMIKNMRFIYNAISDPIFFCIEKDESVMIFRLDLVPSMYFMFAVDALCITNHDLLE